MRMSLMYHILYNYARPQKKVKWKRRSAVLSQFGVIASYAIHHGVRSGLHFTI